MFVYPVNSAMKTKTYIKVSSPNLRSESFNICNPHQASFTRYDLKNKHISTYWYMDTVLEMVSKINSFILSQPGERLDVKSSYRLGIHFET